MSRLRIIENVMMYLNIYYKCIWWRN